LSSLEQGGEESATFSCSQKRRRIASVQSCFDESFRQSELSEKESILPPTTQPNMDYQARVDLSGDETKTS